MSWTRIVHTFWCFYNFKLDLCDECYLFLDVLTETCTHLGRACRQDGSWRQSHHRQSGLHQVPVTLSRARNQGIPNTRLLQVWPLWPNFSSLSLTREGLFELTWRPSMAFNLPLFVPYTTAETQGHCLKCRASQKKCMDPWIKWRQKHLIECV